MKKEKSDLMKYLDRLQEMDFDAAQRCIDRVVNRTLDEIEREDIRAQKEFREWMKKGDDKKL